MSAGILWALASGVGFGVFQVLNRKSQQGLDVYRGTFLLLVISSVVLTIIAALNDELSLLWSAPGGALFYFALAGFIHFFAGWTLLAVSQTQVGAARTGAIVGTTPLAGAIISLVTLGETLSFIEVVAVVMIVVGAYLVTRR